MEQARFEQLAHGLMNQAIKNYIKDEYVEATALLLSEHTEEELTTQVITMQQYIDILGPEMGKLAFSTMIRNGCQSPEVRVVAVIMETWMAALEMKDFPQYEDPAKLQDDLYNTHGSMQNWPEELRTSAIIVNLEHRDGRSISLITPFDEKTHKISEMLEPTAEMTGQMTNWFAPLPRQATQEVGEEE